MHTQVDTGWLKQMQIDGNPPPFPLGYVNSAVSDGSHLWPPGNHRGNVNSRLTSHRVKPCTQPIAVSPHKMRRKEHGGAVTITPSARMQAAFLTCQAFLGNVQKEWSGGRGGECKKKNNN